jgi:hypothetical protein
MDCDIHYSNMDIQFKLKQSTVKTNNGTFITSILNQRSNNNI